MTSVIAAVGQHVHLTAASGTRALTLDPSLGPHKAAVALLGPLATIGEHLDMLRALVAHTMDVPSLYLASPAAGFAATFSAPPLFVSTVGAWLKAGMLSGTRGRGGAATARLLERVWSFQAAASSRLRSSQASEPALDGEHDVGAGGVAMAGSGSGGAAGCVRRLGVSQRSHKSPGTACDPMVAVDASARCARFYGLVVAIRDFWEAAKRQVNGQLYRLGDMRRNLCKVGGHVARAVAALSWVLMRAWRSGVRGCCSMLCVEARLGCGVTASV